MMFRIAIAFALSCAALAAAPARAADVATIGCIRERMSEPLRALVAADIDRGIRDLTNRTEPDSGIRGQVSTVAEACKREHGWSAAATDAAFVYTMAEFSLPIAQAFADERGIDLATLREIWSRRPEEVRSRELPEAVLEELFGEILESGIIRDRNDGPVVAKTLAYLSAREFAYRTFSER